MARRLNNASSSHVSNHRWTCVTDNRIPSPFRLPALWASYYGRPLNVSVFHPDRLCLGLFFFFCLKGSRKAAFHLLHYAYTQNQSAYEHRRGIFMFLLPRPVPAQSFFSKIHKYEIWCCNCELNSYNFSLFGRIAVSASFCMHMLIVIFYSFV